MGISVRRLRASDHVESVQAGEPLNCILQMHPLTPELDAEYTKRAGHPEGFTPQANGSTTVLLSIDPVEAMKAQRWLVEQLVVGWDGLELDNDDGSKERTPFSPRVRDVMADDCFGLIRQLALEVSGRRRREVEGNSAP